LQLYLGAGAYLELRSIEQVSPNRPLPIRFWDLRATLRLAPGLVYDVSDRFFLNLELPLDFLRAEYSQSWGQASVVRQPWFNVPAVDQRSVKFGFGVKF